MESARWRIKAAEKTVKPDAGVYGNIGSCIFLHLFSNSVYKSHLSVLINKEENHRAYIELFCFCLMLSAVAPSHIFMHKGDGAR